MKKIGSILVGLLLLHCSLVALVYYSNLHHSFSLQIFTPLHIIGLADIITMVGLWIYTLLHALQNRALTERERLLWIAAIVILSVFGAILYNYLAPPSPPRSQYA
jgi:hypothetical protein